jgi:multiple sugar transport system ATP-binding protein
MTEIELDDVTKVYNPSGEAVVAVEDLSLTVEDGEFLVLVGPSGCGKSTTLRMVAGLEKITEGTISIGDEVVNDQEPKERDVAMVFQNYALYPHKTVRENIGFSLKYTSEFSKSEIEQRVEDVAEMMGIEELLDDKPKQLSGGQQQRVALGRAIVREPEAFLFDEPLSNLDAKLRTRMRTEIAQLQRDLDVTSVYVTHDQAEAMTMGDRIAILDEGRLQQVGTPNEVYRHPTNRFVAGFIGSPSMNFLEVTLEEFAGGYELVGVTEGDLTYPVEESLADSIDATAGDRLTLGVRPEDVRVTEPDRDNRSIGARVEVVEPMGSDNYLALTVGGEEWTARVSPEYTPDEESAVTLSFDRESLYLFASDGRALKTQGTADTSFHGPEVSPPETSR